MRVLILIAPTYLVLRLIKASLENDMGSDQLQSNGLPLTGFNILLVEDDLTAKDLLCDLLKFHGGASVRAVITAREALETLVQAKPDLLISNIVLPDEDGYALIEQVRKLEPEQGGHTPAIAITASANEKNRTQLLGRVLKPPS